MVGEIARRRGLGPAARECNADVWRQPGGSLVLAAPRTYMNRSGYAARCLVERQQAGGGFDLADLLVVYDDVALPLGRLRLRPGGSPAGHRGMESVIGELHDDGIPRLRLGIAPEEPPEDLVDFVLAPFAAGEEEAVEAMVARAADACEAWLSEGIDSAMNDFNA